MFIKQRYVKNILGFSKITNNYLNIFDSPKSINKSKYIQTGEIALIQIQIILGPFYNNIQISKLLCSLLGVGGGGFGGSYPISDFFLTRGERGLANF